MKNPQQDLELISRCSNIPFKGPEKHLCEEASSIFPATFIIPKIFPSVYHGRPVPFKYTSSSNFINDTLF